MRRALFALGLVLGAVWATAAVAAPSPGEVGQAVNAGAASSVDVGQIAPRGGAAAVAAPDQISAPGGKAEAASLPASAPTDATSAPLVQGSDRCDPAAGREAGSAACRRLLSDSTTAATPQPAAGDTPVIANPDASPSSLVDSIVNGGTGSVVQLPPK